ncbi:MAG: pyridoxal-phosphate dependent enzyme, partial [Ginsengibacter sp.]
MNSLDDPENFTVHIQPLSNVLFDKHNVMVSMLRLDTIHPVVSGNKIFKLHYFLDEAFNSIHKQIITFGGAYSNHLAATAYACNMKGIKSIGIVRGDKPPELSHTLLFCIQNGMQLEFISRSRYQNINDEEFNNRLIKKYGDYILIPEGGFSQKGTKGAELIFNYFNSKKFTHICCPIGTATTFAGLINGSDSKSEIMGFSSLKNLNDVHERLKKLNVDEIKSYSFNDNYHFGGYAKKTMKLIDFMNTFFEDNKIPLDFVYTGKMMFGVYDLI